MGDGKSKVYISCEDQELEVTESSLIASGGVGEVQAVFAFGTLWHGFAKTAVFYQNKNEVYSQVLENDCCDIPWETLTKRGTLYMGVYGVKGSVKRTSNLVKLKIKEGAFSTETATADPTPSVYDQLLSRLYGVHIGSEAPTDSSVMAWIDPNGTPSAGGSGTGSGIASIEIEGVGFDDSEDGGCCGSCSSITAVKIEELDYDGLGDGGNGGNSGSTAGKDGVGITNITITEE